MEREWSCPICEHEQEWPSTCTQCLAKVYDIHRHGYKVLYFQPGTMKFTCFYVDTRPAPPEPALAPLPALAPWPALEPLPAQEPVARETMEFEV